MMRKDFELIAAVLKTQRRDDIFGNVIHAATCHAMADALATTNKQFNRDRFLRACGSPLTVPQAA